MTELVVDALAAYRITRLVIEDTITEPLRQRVKHRAMREVDSPGVAAKVETLLSCPWCVGFWVAVGVVGARKAVPALWAPAALILATSAAVGLIAENA